MKKIKNKLLLLIVILFITLMPNFSNAAKVSVGKVSKIWVSYTTNSKIKVKWKKVNKATGYKVYVYNSSKNKYEAYTSTSGTSIKIKNLKSAKNYKIKVRAYIKKNRKKYFGKYSSILSTSTEPSQTKNVRVTGQNNSTISLSWNKVSRATGYKVYTYNSYSKKNEYKFTTSNTKGIITGLNSAKSYNIKVRAYKKVNGIKYNGDYSQLIQGKTTPSKIIGLKAYDYSFNSISLSWNQLSNEATYKVYMYNKSKGKYESVGKTNNHYFKVTGLIPASEYNFKVRAYIKINEKKYYGDYSTILSTGTCPNKVTGLKVSSTTTDSIKIKWNGVKEANGYAVYVYSDRYQSFRLYKTTTETSAKIKGLTAAKFYKMYVKAYSTIKGVKYYSVQSSTISKKTESTKTEIAGIDVSAHNDKIDWEKVKNAGVDFAILRCGIGQNYKSQDDRCFERNISECERLEIPYGVYLYSYALNTKNASSEADHALRLLKGHNPEYGVWFDMEDADGYKKKNGMPSNKELVNICVTFCEKMIKNGYKTGIYASLSWFNNQLKDSKLDKYEKWVAQWNDHCSYTKDYVMWQYTSSGMIDGINGRVDLNIMYLKISDEPINPIIDEPEDPTPVNPDPTPENPTPDSPDPTPEDPTPTNPEANPDNSNSIDTTNNTGNTNTEEGQNEQSQTGENEIINTNNNG